MLKRHFAGRLKTLLKNFSIVTVLGPRQCGKTSFVRSELPGWKYFDLERPSDASLFSGDPEAMLDGLKGRWILDEAQRMPDLFPILRGLADRQRNAKGLGVILGSASPALTRHVSESLAGRTGFLDMTPFNWNEIASNQKSASMASHWFRGGFPNAFLKHKDPDRFDWFEGYSRTFIERDLPALGIEISPPQMRKLMTMLAHFHGGVWNASQIAASLGASYHTVNRYVDILEQTYLIRKLEPYSANIGKRIIKSPKIYFRDTGMLHYFLGIHSAEALRTHPSRGASWEGYVLEQAAGLLSVASPRCRPYFWRTSSGSEVDLLIECGSQITPLEIKLHSRPSLRDIGSGLKTFMDDHHVSRGYVLYPGQEDYPLGRGITALAADRLLADPARFSSIVEK